MTTYTSAGDGLWSSSSTWSPSGVPGNGDTVTIQQGHTVTFDVDQSSFTTGLAGLTINGILKFKEDTITCLKMASNVSVTLSSTGQFLCGTEDSPIQRPPSGSAYRASIILQGTGQIVGTANSTIKLIGWAKDKNGTSLAADASAGANTLVFEDDLDLQPGDQIVVGAGSQNGPLTESNVGIYTISAYNNNTKTATVTPNLGHARLAGDYVAWHSRTINIVCGASYVVGGPGGIRIYFKAKGVKSNKTLGWLTTIYYYPADEPTVSYCTFPSLIITEAGRSYKIKGLTVHNGTIHLGTDAVIEDATFIHQPGTTYGFISRPNGLVVKNSRFQNAPAIYYYYTYPTPGLGWLILDACTYKNLTNSPFYFAGKFFAYNIDFTGAPTSRLYYPSTLKRCVVPTMTIDYGEGNQACILESYDHNRVDGAYQAWMRGGTIATVDSPAPGTTKSYKYTVTSPYMPVHRQIAAATLQPNDKLYLKGWVKKDSQMSVQPKYYFYELDRDPLELKFDDSGILASVEYPDDTYGEWKLLKLTYKNTTNRILNVGVRFQAQLASGESAKTVYEYPMVYQRQRGGSTIRIA